MQIKPEKKCAYLFLFRVKASFALVNAKAYLQGEKKNKNKKPRSRQANVTLPINTQRCPQLGMICCPVYISPNTQVGEMK